MSGNVTLKSETPRVSASGLDNVVAAETALSHVDGEAGRLIVAGYEVEDLVKAHDFEGAVAALWRAAGLDPAPSEGDVREALGRAREAAYGYIPALLSSKCHRTVTRCESGDRGRPAPARGTPRPPPRRHPPALAGFCPRLRDKSSRNRDSG